eukprot:NODE_172_length_2817_cov_513.501115_g159_i0.p1 GENE.NODE_172_length_2817_cov_513.501115_g159_i0~~NODE_172_length_2817_cov_513.501115_g159_i0.p1  ORF type:complete len:647 (+),score=201.93 NODE_172_length_2817_cov_513.501115_g159_i0:786-2726(+)
MVRIAKQTYDLTPNEKYTWTDRTYGKLRLIPGASTKLVSTDYGPMLNIDIKFRMMHAESVLDLLDFGVKNQDLERRFAVVSYSSKAIMIDRLTTDIRADDKFTCRVKGEETEMTYFEYLCMKYPNQIREGDLKTRKQPMIVVKDRMRDGQESYFLAQYCYVTGLTDKMRTDHNFMRDLRARTGGDAAARAELTQQLVLPQRTNDRFYSILDTWGLKLTNHLLALSSTKLNTPQINFGDNSVTKAGKWAMFDAASRRSHTIAIRPKLDAAYCILADARGQDDDFARELEKQSRDIDLPLRMKYCETRSTKIEYFLEELRRINDKAHSDEKILVVIMMPDKFKQGDLYTRIKQMTLKSGIITQCVLCAPRKGGNGQKAQMVAVQIVAKLGGVPWTVSTRGSIPMDGTMIIGFDFHHSKAGGTKASLLGCVASINTETMQCWSTAVEVATDDPIADTNILCEVFSNALNAYHQAQGCFPQRVVVFRNGVGESQYLNVGRREVRGLASTLEAASPTSKLCFCLTFKNNTARLFTQEGGNRLNNPPPGTVLDGEAISNQHGFYEFLLVPQSVTQGCVMPIRIVTLHNEITMLTAQALQSLTYQLCHSYFNWFGTIKMPSPVEYAGRLAKFVGTHREDKAILPELHDGFYWI